MSTTYQAHMLAGAPAGIPAPPRWDDVWGDPAPRHAGAAFKPAPGRPAGSPAITGLYVHDDEHVLIGFGDWEANDGSTPLVTFNPENGASQTHDIYGTEGFQTFRPNGAETLALYVDPVGFWDPTPPFATYPPRENIGTIDAIHVFDALAHDGRLWVCGSAHGSGTGVAAVWYSDDNGQTWTRTTPTGVTGDWERAYRLGLTPDGRVAVQLNIPQWSEWAYWYAWTGSGWESTAYPGPDPYAPPVPPYPVPTGGVVARTSTRWILGTRTGDIYTLPA